jgi:hypothetical protein
MAELYGCEVVSLKEFFGFGRIQGGWPAQWPWLNPECCAGQFVRTIDEYGREIFELPTGERWSWESWADDYLPLLT